MAKEVSPPAQVIKIQNPRTPSIGDWTEAKRLTEEIKALAKEVERDLDSVAEKYNKLAEKSVEAYRSAPLTDCGFGVSPIGGGRIFFAVKQHLMKRNMRLDSSYFGDITKLPTFTQTIKEATDWLLKFS